MGTIQLQLSKRRKDKEYYKWVFVIPKEVIKKSGFKVGEDLQMRVEDRVIFITRKKKE